MAGSPARLAGVAKRMISTRVERSDSPSGKAALGMRGAGRAVAGPLCLRHGLRLNGQRTGVIYRLRGRRLVELLLSQPTDAAALEQAGDQQAAQRAFYEFEYRRSIPPAR